MKRLALAIVFVLGFPPAAWADFQAGVAAYGRGDYAMAFREMKPLAEQGHAPAQHNLGGMYSEGQGVPLDYAEAVRWYRKAAEQGLAQAQYNLGGMYRKEQSVPQDYAEAVKWYGKAAEQGYATAQINLGVMYENGQGVPQDYVQAHKWANLAASRLPFGKLHNTAVKNRDIVAAKMSPAQIAEAQRLARDWELSAFLWATYDPDMASGQSSELSEQNAAMVRVIQEQVGSCWHPDPVIQSAENIVVETRVLLNPDGSVKTVEILDVARMVQDSYFRSTAENVKHAIMRCSPLRLPVEKYEVWKQLTLQFDPRSAEAKVIFDTTAARGRVERSVGDGRGRVVYLLPFVLLNIVLIVGGAWTGWKWRLTQTTYAIIYSTLLVAMFVDWVIFGILGMKDPSESSPYLTGLSLIGVGLYFVSLGVGVHVVVRRLNTVGWSKWLGCIPVISALIGFVLLFKRTPQLVADEGE